MVLPPIFYTGLMFLAVGMIVVLPLFPIQRIGRGFAGVLIASAFVLATAALYGHPGGVHSGVARGTWTLHKIGIGLIILWLATAFTFPIRWSYYGILVLACWGFAWLGLFSRWVAISLSQNLVSALITSASSAILLGSVSAGMVLGHWYLVNRRLKILDLEHAAELFLGASVFRLVWEILLTGTRGWTLNLLHQPLTLTGVLTLQRWAFGLLIPPVFAWMILRTVRLRSTQSATGILYAAMVMTILGEFVGVYLWLHP